ncbi:hypothetical protein RRG08_057201 [Elysia crispata]|uniref:Uncharacterized protein n=1 Tax=Elysia crispata TaxID=231223 RepID=A0AAE0XWG9_9GAST|nr:hypothetical protein RRG08_057201 [Elysia crispata]
MFLPQLVNPDNAKQRVGELTLQFSGIKIELQMEAILQCAWVQGVQLEKVTHEFALGTANHSPLSSRPLSSSVREGKGWVNGTRFVGGPEREDGSGDSPCKGVTIA